jgi:hypothetical protein
VSEPSERLVQSLASDLSAVRPLPPLRRMLGVIGLLGVAAFGFAFWLRGTSPQLFQVASSHPAYLCIWIGLLAVAVGGLVAALAGAVPGRQLEARTGVALMTAGALLAIGVGGLLAFTGTDAGGAAAPPRAAGICLSLALALGFPAAVVGLGFVLRGWPARPLACLLAAAAGAGALGAFVTHMTCVQVDALHLMLGHLLGPLLGAALLTIPLQVLARGGRRDRRA